MVSKEVLVAVLIEFTKRKPFQVQSENSVLGKCNATLLFVFDRFSRRPDVPVYVQDCRNLAVHVFRLIQERDRLESRDNFVAQFMYAVSLPGDDSNLFKFGCRVHPLTRPAMEHNFVQKPFAQTNRLGSPLLRTRWRGRLCHTMKN